MEDVDDNPVVFTLASYSVSLFENVPTETYITTVIAEDDDQFQSNLIVYSLIPSTDSFPFRIDSQSGDIFTTMPLDREVVSAYRFTVTASNTPNHTASATVTVAVMDVNDVVPRFTNTPYDFELSESVSPVRLLGTVLAADDDEGTNGMVVEYRMEPRDSVLEVIGSTGTIRLVQALDRETTDFYNFTVFAVDGGDPSLTGSISLTLTVADVNDNHPIFTTTNVTVTLSDADPPGTLVTSLPASDADIGDNANITYSISSAELVPFSVDSVGNVVTSEALVAAQIVPYSFTVVASDSGTPSLSSSVSVLVYVTDVNQRPVFAQNVYFLSIVEGSDSGTQVDQIEAVDPDNDQITYSLTPLGSAFTVGPTTGSITVAGILDRETTDSYNLTLLATDAGLPPLSSSVHLVVSVLDVNDNPPVFTLSFITLDIPEDAEIGEIVLVLSASDRDIGNNAAVLYSIVEDSSDGKFSLNATSGELSVEEELNFETAPIYQLRVEARDGGQPPRTDDATIFLLVTDVNDNVPVFTQTSYSANLSESAPVNSFVVTVSASDDDSGENGVVRYRISENSTGMFAVGMESGIVTTLAALDREVMAFHDIAVEAYNPNLPSVASTVTVTLTVLDVNDEAPVFNQTDYTFRVDENSPLGRVVGSVPAVDRDEGDNREIRYSFNDSTQFFDINPFTGEISVGEAIDREIHQRFEFVVVANDLGSPVMMMSSVSVTIFVNDLNDNQPVVMVQNRNFTFFEGSLPINIGTGISVTDEDSFPIASVTVSILLDSTLQPNEGDILSVDASGIAGIAVNQSSGSQQVVLEGPASSLHFTQVLQTLSFANEEDEPTAGTRVARITAFDGDYYSNTELLRVRLELVNDNPPTLDLSLSTSGLDHTVVFTESGPSVLLVGNDVQLMDLDGDSVVQSVNITLTNPLDRTNEAITIVIPATSSVYLSASSTSHHLVLMGPVSHQETINVLLSVSYINRADEPAAQTREVVFIVSDGLFQSQPAHTSITIANTNDPPLLLLGNGTTDTTVLYVESAPSVTLTNPSFQLFDVDSEFLSAASISISNPQIGIESLNITLPASSTLSPFRHKHTDNSHWGGYCWSIQGGCRHSSVCEHEGNGGKFRSTRSRWDHTNGAVPCDGPGQWSRGCYLLRHIPRREQPSHSGHQWQRSWQHVFGCL